RARPHSVCQRRQRPHRVYRRDASLCQMNAFRILINSSWKWRGKPVRVLMVVENFPYMSDPRVRNESRTFAANGYEVSVICPAKGREPWHEVAAGVRDR